MSSGGGCSLSPDRSKIQVSSSAGDGDGGHNISVVEPVLDVNLTTHHGKETTARVVTVDTVNLSTASFETQKVSQHIQERQIAWDQQAASADLEQAELYHRQWNLIREQIRSFSSEVMAMRYKMKNLEQAESEIRQVLMEVVEAERRERVNGDEKQLRKASELVEEERVQRVAVYDNFEQELRRLRASLEDEGRRRQAGDSEAIQEIGRQLEDEAKTRTLFQTNLAGVIKSLQDELQALRQSLESEAGERSVGDDRSDRRLGEFRSLFEVELQNIVRDSAAALEQERAERERMRSQLSSYRQELIAEKEERAEEDATLRRSMQSDVRQVQSGISYMREALDKEVEARKAGDESQAEIMRRNDVALRDVLSTEVRALQTSLLEGELQKIVRDSAAALEQERAERERMRSQLSSYRQELTAEKEERAEEDATLRRSMLGLEGYMREALDKEVEARVAGDESQAEIMRRNDVALRDVLSTEVRAFQTSISNERAAEEFQARELGNDLEGRMLSKLRAALDFEGKERALAVERLDAVASGFQAQLKEVEEMISLEEDARATGDKVLKQLFDASAGREDSAGLNRERIDREAQHHTLHELLRNLTEQAKIDKAEFEEAVGGMRRGLNEEVQRLWDAMDTHTHDVNVDDETVDVSTGNDITKTSSKTVQIRSSLSAPYAVAGGSQEVQLPTTRIVKTTAVLPPQAPLVTATGSLTPASSTVFTAPATPAPIWSGVVAPTYGANSRILTPSTHAWSQAATSRPATSGNYVGTVSVEKPWTSMTTSSFATEDALVRMGSGVVASPRHSAIISGEEIQVLTDTRMDAERAQYVEMHHAEKHSKHHVEAHTGHAKYNTDMSAAGEHRHN